MVQIRSVRRVGALNPRLWEGKSVMDQIQPGVHMERLVGSSSTSHKLAHQLQGSEGGSHVEKNREGSTKTAPTMISSPRTTIDLTMEDDEPRQPKRIEADVGSTPSPQPYPSSVSSFPAQSYSYSTSSSSTPYRTGSPWSSQCTPAPHDTQTQQPPYTTQSAMPSQPSPSSPSTASPYHSAPPRTVIDPTGQQPQSYAAQQPQASGTGQAQQGQQAVAGAPAKDVRREVVCIGQFSSTALITYPTPYVFPKPDQPLASLPAATSDGDVPVRLKYDDAAKGRQRNPAQSAKETIQILVPRYKGGASGTELLGGEEFGVVEQRTAMALGPLMAKVLIRLKAHVRRTTTTTTTTTTPILPLRVLIFTPRGNVKVVVSYLHFGGITLEHPTVPYIPSEHRDSPPYENPHQAGGVGALDYRYNNTVQNSTDIAQLVQARDANDHPERTPSDGNTEQLLTPSGLAITVPRRYTIYPTCKTASQTTNQTAGVLVLGETSDEKALCMSGRCTPRDHYSLFKQPQ